MQISAMRATAFSRHSMEATMMAGDKMEALRTVTLDNLAYGTDFVDAKGVSDPGGMYWMEWGPVVINSETSITVGVCWSEAGVAFVDGDPQPNWCDEHRFNMYSVRTQ
jgi:hypothetical protein